MLQGLETLIPSIPPHPAARPPTHHLLTFIAQPPKPNGREPAVSDGHALGFAAAGGAALAPGAAPAAGQLHH